MIIGFEAKRLFQNRSGLGNYSRNTVNLLSANFPEHKYLLFAPILTDLYPLPPGVEVIIPQSLFSRKLRPFWRLYRVIRMLKQSNVDIYHGLSNVLPFGIRKSGIPSVLTVHDLIFLKFPAFYKRTDRMLYKLITTRSCHNATKIIAISHQTKTDLVDMLGIDPGKIEVIHQSCNGVFYEKVPEEVKQAVRLRYSLPEKFILSVGTIEQRKNQLAILEGVAREKIGTPVVFLGKPTPYKQVLDAFIAGADIGKQVMYLHGTDLAELQAIYQMAELTVYPSFYEGFGLPVLEAQASGCPVITSANSSLTEAGGDGAMYIDPSNSAEIGQAIRLLLTDTDTKQDFIRKGNANAALFSEKAIAAKLMNLYHSVVADSANR